QADAAEQADPADRSATEALVEREDAEAHEPHGDDGTAEVHRARGNKAKRRARLAQDRRIPDVAHHASWADAGHARRADAQLTARRASGQTVLRAVLVAADGSRRACPPLPSSLVRHSWLNSSRAKSGCQVCRLKARAGSQCAGHSLT
ncbi:unnamed protein product, partial [Prorocentrum cordatum]